MNAAAVIEFWFVELDPKQWWSASQALDQTIADRFGPTHARLAQGEGFAWRDTASGRLAEVIVLDQFSRQLQRGRAEAFAQDGMALVLAQEAVRLGADRELGRDQRMFLYMPFQHSESLLVHEAAMPLFEALEGEDARKSAVQHLDVLRRFGRDPQRTAALGRLSTPEETDYLAQSGDRMF